MLNQEQKRCLDCGKVMSYGRTDKLYCDDICRARATRKRLKQETETGHEDAHKAVIRAIKRNYALLKKAVGDREQWIVDFEPLYRKGFNRMFYTSAEPSENSLRYYCFELGWEDISEGRLQVTVNKQKLEVFDPDSFGPVNTPSNEPGEY
ncbi:hypothetical protein [Mucilaginibacter sp. SG564]|uniref:hypothetical protein n=1 Tax=Mucilaginibacter sp. SG564 TaxID=2587022 RepID=UPI0015550408|nr:hypothetical protein [Mucilaginibacter sp. SG564]NOW95843.1 hypothetical protein [Mucilaginibacter sp. SG564]